MRRQVFANFLPPSVADIQDVGTIAFLQQLQRQVIQVSCQQGSTEIATTCLYSPRNSSTTPILLLHGFDSSLIEFRHLFPLLVPYNETWALDCYGFGFTEYGPELAVNPHTLRQHLLGTITIAVAILLRVFRLF